MYGVADYSFSIHKKLYHKAFNSTLLIDTSFDGQAVSERKMFGYNGHLHTVSTKRNANF